MADSGLMEHARVYVATRKAVFALYDAHDEAEAAELESLLARYRPLEKADLNANTALIEHGTCGLSKLHLPWFWSLDVEGDSQGVRWMDESKSNLFAHGGRGID